MIIITGTCTYGNVHDVPIIHAHVHVRHSQLWHDS